MSLSNDIVTQFVKITRDGNTTKKEATLYGTVVKYNNEFYVRLDGSDLLTPATTTSDVQDGERVTVLVKDHTATVTGNITSPSARTDDVKAISNKIDSLDIIVADKVSANELVALNAKIGELEADNVTINGTLTANQVKIDELTANDVVIDGRLTANRADIDYLKADNVVINDTLTANNAKIENLEADVAKIDYLEADVADIETLIFGSASGDVIQTSFANAVIAQLGNAQIKSAMIENVSADKITAGDIITNNVRVMSEDGSLVISDETIQISDETRVRVQIGKDSANDYSINIWDADGNLMFSEGGITDSAIKEAIIRNDMVSDAANISASKLDIDSLFEEINGSTKTIKSTKIYMDDEGQTLDVAFTTMATAVDGINDSVSSQGTQISVIQGQITNKIWQEDIDNAITESNEDLSVLRTQYSELVQDIDGISATVANHTTEIDNKANESDVTTIRDQVSELEISLTGFKSLVSSTYATKQQVNDIEVGARNLLVGSSNGNGWAQYDTFDAETHEFVRTTTGTSEVYIYCENVFTLEADQEYTISFDAKQSGTKDGGMDICILPATWETTGVAYNQAVTNLSDEYTHIVYTFTPLSSATSLEDCMLRLDNNGSTTEGTEAILYVKNIQLEKGNKATDWTPAPEDVDESISDVDETANDAQQMASDTNEQLLHAESVIEQLADSISMLVTDENGTSHMTQNGTSWTFNISEITNTLDSATTNIDSLTESLGGVDNTVQALEQAVNDLGVLTDYVVITTYNDQPCIELGEKENNFKLRITNTDIQFMDGSAIPAYLSNQKLYIENAEVTDELQFGGFVWKVRSNGNMGLMWKGVTE